VANYREALNADQNSLEGEEHGRLASSLLMLGSQTEAIYQFDLAAKKDKTSGTRWSLKRANTLRSTGDLHGALDGYKSALDQDPQSSDACLSLGITLLKLNRFAEAKKA
jgi:tetratricopeptide (TPR) repeat protein